MLRLMYPDRMMILYHHHNQQQQVTAIVGALSPLQAPQAPLQ